MTYMLLWKDLAMHDNFEIKFSFLLFLENNENYFNFFCTDFSTK